MQVQGILLISVRAHERHWKLTKLHNSILHVLRGSSVSVAVLLPLPEGRKTWETRWVATVQVKSTLSRCVKGSVFNVKLATLPFPLISYLFRGMI